MSDMKLDPDTLLRRLEPHLDAIICFASTCEEHEPNALARDVRAYLATAKADAGVRVKKLEWVAVHNGWLADDGRYHIDGVNLHEDNSAKFARRRYNLTTAVCLPMAPRSIRFTTLDEAKAAAQADYEARVLSCLEADAGQGAGAADAIANIPYQKLFDAIAAATTIWPDKKTKSGISISVGTFRAMLASAPKPAETTPQPQAGDEVEAVARAIYEAHGVEPYEGYRDGVLWARAVESAKAALAAARPIIVAETLERAAKVADDVAAKADDWDSSYWDRACEVVASRIRSLKGER